MNRLLGGSVRDILKVPFEMIVFPALSYTSVREIPTLLYIYLQPEKGTSFGGTSQYSPL